jgi:hypothetical protein
MELHNIPFRINEFGGKVCLGLQNGEVVAYRLTAVCDLHVTGAEVAERIAEREVKIERQIVPYAGAIGSDDLLFVVGRTELLREVRSGWIARITRPWLIVFA